MTIWSHFGVRYKLYAAAILMKLLLISASALWDARAEAPYAGISDTIRDVLAKGNSIFVVSSHPEPEWLSQHFAGVKFQSCGFRERQNGIIVQRLLDVNALKGLRHSDVVVFGASDADFFMAVNS